MNSNKKGIIEKSDIKVGVIIIGSLIWDKDPEREKWRKENLSLSRGLKVKLPIVYGRSSSSRHNTYTMVYTSPLLRKKYGLGLVVPIKQRINSFSDLLVQGEKLAKAEGIWKEKMELVCNWGLVSILAKGKIGLKYKREWIQYIRSLKYGRVNDKVRKVVDDNHVNLFRWPKALSLKDQNELNKLDVLLTTVTYPKNRKEYRKENSPKAEEIADAMIQSNCFNYFLENRKNKIQTNDDEKILVLLNKFFIKPL